MKSIKRNFRKFYVRQIIAVFLAGLMFFGTSITLAAPNVADPGTAAITQSSNTTNVGVTAAQTIIGWNSLNTAANESLNFTKSGVTDAAVLNRVISGSMTQFDGSMTAQTGMKIFMVNPAGIVFGPTAVINVPQLVASGLNITDTDFMAGHYEFSGGNGAVINQGQIIADGVALIGKMVQNIGTITTTSGGYVAMVAGDRVLLGEPGSKIVIETDSVSALDAGVGSVTNNGTINAPAGQVVLAAGDIFSAALSLDAKAVKVIDGIGTVAQNGTINADGTAGDGGIISITAGSETTLCSASVTTANAGTGGDSGLVIVHSSGDTSVQSGAKIEAKGGNTPDADKTVKTSVLIAGNQVNLAGSVDASAAISSGQKGKVVLDALNWTIADGSKPVSPPDNTLYEKWIEAQSQANTDLEVVAHSPTNGNIIVNNISDGIITGGSGDIAMRTVYNTGGITFLSPGTTSLLTNKGGSIYMLAGSGGITTGNITTNVPSNDKVTDPGKIRLLTTNGGDITTGALTVDGGSYDEISAIASPDAEHPGDLTINGSVQVTTNQVPSVEKRSAKPSFALKLVEIYMLTVT